MLRITNFIGKKNDFFKKYGVELLVLIIILIVFIAVLFNKYFQNPYYYFAADISEAYFPWWIFQNYAVHSLKIPLLNPYWFGGSLPFAALETGVFYPIYLIFHIFFNAKESLNNAYLVFYFVELLHYLIAGIGFYLLTRFGLKLSNNASIFGAVVYACSGSFVGRFTHIPTIITMSWLPYVYAFYLLFIEKRVLIFAVMASLALSMIVLSGHPQLVLYTYGFFGLFVIYSTFFNREKKGRLFLALSSFLIILVSLLLTAFKVLLSLETATILARTTYETTISNLYNSIPIQYYLTLLVPYIFGKHQVGYWGSDYPWGNWENFLYIGVIPLLFLVYAMGWRNRRLLFFFIINLFLVIFILLGKYNPISSEILRILPYANTTTMVSKFTIFFHFFLVVLVSVGVSVVGAKVNTSGKRRQIIVGILLIIFIFAILNKITLSTVTSIGFLNRQIPSADALSFISGNIFQAKFLFILGSGAFIFFLFKKNMYGILMIFVIYALDMLLSVGGFNPIEASPGTPQKYFGNNQIIEVLKKDTGIYRIENLWPRNINMVQRIETTYGYHTIETKEYKKVSALVDIEKNPSLYNLLNVKYIISERDLSNNSNFSNLGNNIWKNNLVLPRVFSVPSFRIFNNEQEIALYMVNGKFDPSKEVLFTNQIKFLLEKMGIVNFPLKSINTNVKIFSYEPERIKVNVTTDDYTFLVFSQYRYPGWTVIVDGSRRNLLPANLSFYAIPIEKGEHVVEFRYISRTFNTGIVIAALTSTLLLIIFLQSRHLKF